MNNITIPKPCHENWSKMTPQEKGRHCGVCQKVVKDFTNMSTGEILNTLAKTSEEVCGRIDINQLTPVNQRQKLMFWLKGTLVRRVVYSGLAFIGFTFLLKNKATAQKGEVMIKGKVAYQPEVTGRQELTIKVVSNTGSVINAATVRIFSGGHLISMTATDADGTATVKIYPDKLVNKEVSVEVEAPGFNRHETEQVRLSKEKQALRIVMEEQYMIMGNMVFVPDPADTTVIDSTKMRNEVVNPINEEPVLLPVSCTGELPVIEESIVVEESTRSEENTDFFEEQVIGLVAPQSRFSAFPVPAWSQVTIESLNEADAFSLEIFDNNGSKIRAVRNAGTRYQLDVSGWAPGIYYVLFFVQDKAIETKKIIVAH